MKKLSLTLIVLVSVLSAGCGSGGSIKVSASGNNGAVQASNTNTKIINGTEVDPAASPQIVQIQMFASDGSTLICSGTVIGADHVLTAGHCFPPAIVSANVIVGGIPVPVVARNVHPGYFVDNTVGAIFNDVAVIQTAAPLGLPALPIIASRPVESGESIGIWGYGLDENGELGTLKTGTMVLDWVSPNHLAATFEDEQNTCNGDSGGPATAGLTDEAGNLVAVGIAGVTSTGSKLDCSEGDLSLFANLQNGDIISFILSVAPETGLI